MSPVPDRAEELAALCASGAASADERAELESLAAENPEVRELVRSYDDAASLLALDLPRLSPPAGGLDALRQRLVPIAGRGGGGSGGGEPGLPPGRPGPGPGADIVPLAGRRRSPAVALAVVLPLAAAAGFALFWWQERGRGDELRERTALLEKENQNERRVRTRAEEEANRLRRQLGLLESTLAQVSTPELTLRTVSGTEGRVLKVLLDPLTGNWYVLAFRLPEAAHDKDYQLWFLDQKGNPIPSELFRPGPSSGSLQALTQVPPGVDPTGAAISLEPKGGSPSGLPGPVLVGGPLL